LSDGILAVVGTLESESATAVRQLLARKAIDTWVRSLGGERCVVYGRFSDEESARDAVGALRREGWAAAQRPTDDDSRIVGWRNRTQPVIVAGGKLVVCLPWAEFDREGKNILEIDPGAAFGAGTHPTTRLILEELATRIKGGESVLDVGCGSGALALAALRLGAATAVGIDIENAAIAATRANAERNGLAARITALATPLQDLTGAFDVAVANIGRDILAELAPHIEDRLSPGGWLALSGISPAQVSLLSKEFRRTELVAAPQLDDWCALVGFRL
jgi:ribosomal protein L11 methyltransferase